MARWGMTIDLDRCTGCQACSFACISENNSPYATPEESARGIRMAWNDFLVFNEGAYPTPRQRIVPRPCMQCGNAPCVKVCPVAATYKGEQGITMQDGARCIGCRACLVACPYGARTFNWFDARTRFPESFENLKNPLGQPLRPVGTAEKCIFCTHRLDRLRADLAVGGGPRVVREAVGERLKPGVPPGEAVWAEAVDVLMRFYAEGAAGAGDLDPAVIEYLPACVTVCPPQARVFGDLDAAGSAVAERARDPRAEPLLGELGTDPSVTYLRAG